MTRRLPGAELALYEGLFTAGESEQLLARLLDGSDTPGGNRDAAVCWRQDVIRLFGRTQVLPRLTAWHGDPGRMYRYSGIVMEPQAWTPLLQSIRRRVERLTGFRFNAVLLNAYRDGRDSVGWHSDDEPELGPEPVIASLSIGAEREFQMRHRDWRQNALPTERFVPGNGSVLVMSGTTQQYWQHRLPKRPASRPCGPRVNLSFRTIFSSPGPAA